MKNKSDKEIHELTKRSMRGDDKAQTELFAYFYPRMANVCKPFCKTREDLEDTLMAGFGNVFSNLHRYAGKSGGEMYNWMKMIFRNQAIDDQRWRTRRSPKSVVDTDGDEPFVVDTHDSATAMDYNLVIDTIGTRLPKRMSEALTLCAVNGLSCQEAAAEMGTSEGNVRVLVHRARAMMNKMHPEYAR